MGTPDPNAPDPGPQPQDENLTPEQLLAKWGSDLDARTIREQVIGELVRTRMLNIASGRKATADQKAFSDWEAAYIKRYGTDEG